MSGRTEITLLGSGAADGWPNPFCACASCGAAARAGQVRAQTAALLGGRLMFDCGPEAPRAAVRRGRSLAGVRHLLFTHAHPDHLGPAALLFRSWAGRTEPLDVIGPADVIAECRRWTGPDDPVRFVEVAPGDEVTVGGGVAPGGAAVPCGGVMAGAPAGGAGDAGRDGGPAFRIRALAARHRVRADGDAVVYDVSVLNADGPAGRVFWATDTGLLPRATVEAVHGARFDAVFLEETFGDRTDLGGGGHLNLTTFPRALAALRECGAVAAETDVVTVHMSHHNPPPDELAGRLARWGAVMGQDGMTFDVTGLGAAGAAHAEAAAVGGGARRTLVLGGARSGKSALAEQLLADRGDVTYIATGGAGRDDAEWRERVATHRARRPGSWRTVETVDAAERLRTADAPVLLDCLGTWLTGRLDLRGAWREVEGPAGPDGGAAGATPDGGAAPDAPGGVSALDLVDADIAELVAAWRACPHRVVAVSNEVGSGVVPATASGRVFRDLLGRLNAAVAAQSDEVFLTVAGLEVRLR